MCANSPRTMLFHIVYCKRVMTENIESSSAQQQQQQQQHDRMLYVIEHMETEFSPWVVCEYKRMVRDCGASNLLFTNMKPGINCPPYEDDSMAFLQGAKLVPDTFEEYFHGQKDRVCLLDEQADSILQPSDQGKFDYFLFGGILGNVDEQDMDRTSELRVHGYSSRHLGPDQMTTPTAVDVTYRVLDKQEPIKSMNFVNRPEFEVNDCEILQIPFKYLADKDGNAIISEGILEILTDNLEWNLDSLM